ncbi:MAG: hypothetical protein AVDCRST_MAG30-2900, partial [uncultured Solirubrobacteraceae bacterium]
RPLRGHRHLRPAHPQPAPVRDAGRAVGSRRGALAHAGERRHHPHGQHGGGAARGVPRGAARPAAAPRARPDGRGPGPPARGPAADRDGEGRPRRRRAAPPARRAADPGEPVVGAAGARARADRRL